MSVNDNILCDWTQHYDSSSLHRTPHPVSILPISYFDLWIEVDNSAVEDLRHQ